MKLWEIAHARTGDKGNTSNISLTVHNLEHFKLIKDKVTNTRLKQWYGDQVKGDIIRYELPHLGALNFVMYDALNGGVTNSTALDKHGKTLGAQLLNMIID